MKLFLLSAFVLLAVASSSPLDSQADSYSNGYLVTAPKIFVGEETVCLTLFNRKSVASDAIFKVELKSLDDEILFESEKAFKSGKNVFYLKIVFFKSKLF